MKVAWTYFMESQRHLRPIKRVRQSRVREGDVIRHQVKCPAQTPSSFPTLWKFCLAFRVSILRDSQHVTLQRNASVVLVISRSGLANTANVDLVLDWGSPLLPFTNKYWPRELFTDLELPLPSFKHNAASPDTTPLRKRIKKVFFSQLNRLHLTFIKLPTWWTIGFSPMNACTVTDQISLAKKFERGQTCFNPQALMTPNPHLELIYRKRWISF